MSFKSSPLNLDEAIKLAKDKSGYFITISVLDSEISEIGENNLTHFAFKENFPIDDVIPSIDSCMQSMGVKSSPPSPVKEVKELNDTSKPLRIAILTHFNSCPEAYSPGKAVRNQIKMLQQFGHDVAFFVTEGSKLDFGCKMMPVIPRFKRKKNVVNEDIKAKTIDVLREHLTGNYDIAITHDFYIDDCITYREAIKECGVDIDWVHWARSGVGMPIDFNMSNARYVYMNYADKDLFAGRIGVNPDRIRICFNEKDPSLLFNWNNITTHIVNKMKLWKKDIVEVFPICSTRMAAKGIHSLFQVFGELKKQGKNVALVICNSNGRRRGEEIKNKLETALANFDLVDGEDIIFTSQLHNPEKGIDTLTSVPHEVVAQLMQMSNLFVFPTKAEVCSNVLLEASIAGNLLVLNSDTKALLDFMGEGTALTHPFTSSTNIHYSQRDNDSMRILAKKIIGQLDSNKSDKQKRLVWMRHNTETIYNDMLKPILYEKMR